MGYIYFALDRSGYRHCTMSFVNVGRLNRSRTGCWCHIREATYIGKWGKYSYRKWLLPPQFYGGFFYSKVQKFKKKIHGCSPPCTLCPCKLYWNTLYFRLGKKINWTNFRRFKRLHGSCSEMSFLSFFLWIEYKVFHKENLHTGRINDWLHSSIFFEGLNLIFSKNFKNKLHGAHVPS
jgi:hypothetical protein